jgi:TP901 family phage tail tape measure protein
VALRTVGVRLTADIGQYQSKIRLAAQATKDFQGQLERAGKKGNLDKVADTAGIVGLGLVGLAATAVKSAADFDKSMSAVAAATHAPKDQIDQLRAAAIQAGKDTQYSATEAADGITELSKAGVSTASILGGGLKGALSLAAAGQLSVGEAAETAASAMTQFKLSGDQVPHVADLLAAAAGKAQGSVHDMGAALNQSGLVAAQFGLSIEDTTGVLGEFAHAGLLGSDAGTSLKTMLLAIANPSKQTRDLMDELGISFYDASGKFIGMSGVAQVLQTRLKGLTDAQRQQALGQIFGNDAIRSASILYTDGAAGVAKWKNAVNASGYAAQTASKLTDNLSGDLERLRGSVETLFITSGSSANSGLRVLVKTLNGVVDQIGNMSPATTGTIVVLGGLTGVLLLGGAAWLKYQRFVAEAQAQLIATGPAGEKAAGALGKVSSALGKVGMWAAAAEAAGLLFSNLDDKSSDVDRLTDSLQNFITTGKTVGEMKDIFGGDFDKLGRIAQFADSANNGYGHFVDKVAGSIPIFGDAGRQIGNFGSRLIAGTDFDTAKAQMADLDTALMNNISSIHDYNKASALWQQVLSKSGLDTQHLAELLPNTWKELQKEAAASEGTAKALNKYSGSAAAASGNIGDLNSALAVGADAQDKYKTEADAVAGAARGERAALSALHSMLKAETDPVFALIDAQGKLRQAQDAATKAVKEHGKTSKEVRAADLELAKAALGVQDAAGNLASSFNGKLDPAFRETLRAAGLNKNEINNVAKAFQQAKKDGDRYAHAYVAPVSAPGAKQSKTDIDRAYAAGKQYDGTYIARLSINGATEVSSKLDELLVKQRALQTGLSVSAARGAVQKDLDRNRQGKYATGGQVGGWSPHSRADNIPAWLTAKEWVHPVDAVDYYGTAAMSAIQHKRIPREVLTTFASGQLGKRGDLPIPGLASGGQVGWKFVDNVSRTKVPSWSEVLSHIPGGNAASFLRAQNGKPYVWASAGPGGYDCSGIVSAVYNLLHGRSPYSHTFSTGSLPGGWFTKPGIGGPLTAAWSNPGEAPASSTTGHMMGMAGGLTFESTGSRGVHLGATTRRLTDFAHIAHYANGGHVAMANGGTITEPVFGVGASGRTYSFGENYQPERVIPNWQSSGAAPMGGGGTTVVHITNTYAAGANLVEAGRIQAQQLKAYLNNGGTIVLTNGTKVLP